MIDRKDWEEAAQSFECSLMILRKDTNGWVIGFSVHPNEVPESLLAAPLGTRFRTVLFQVGDDEKPVPVPGVRDGKKAVALAGKLCRKEAFQVWILKDRTALLGVAPTDSVDAEAQAADELRDTLGIESRSELVGNTEASELFWKVVEEFNEESLGEEVSLDDCPF